MKTWQTLLLSRWKTAAQASATPIVICACYVIGVSQGRKGAQSARDGARLEIITRLQHSGQPADFEAAEKVKILTAKLREEEAPQDAKSVFTFLYDSWKS